MVTDNQYVVNAVIENQSTITYEKKRIKEQRVNPSGFAAMDTKSFNTKIGFITNIASTLIAMLSSFPKESEEYKEIKKRISLLRYFQGVCIDSAKGDVFIPPPKYWNKKQKYLIKTEDMTEEQIKEIDEKNKIISFNNRICADKKPYFFGYIYPQIMTEYNIHRNNYKQLCKIYYNCSVFDLMRKENRTSEENKLLYQFNHYSPLLKNKCIMNILSEYVEDMEFDNKWKKTPVMFDYTQLMSNDYDLSDKELYKRLKDLIAEFNKNYNNVIKEKKSILSVMPELDDDNVDCFHFELLDLIKEYENKIFSLCSNEDKLCDYLIDIYYRYYNNKSKIFIWETFGEVVLRNIKSKATEVQYPIVDENGVDYLGRKYSIKKEELK